MKRYWFLAAIGFVILAWAAVWLGALNQDEGWYLYAARLVSEGKVLYRDFFYTQAPVMPVVYSAFTSVWDSFGILGARIFTLAVGVAGVLLACALAWRLADKGSQALAALVVFFLLGSNLYHLYFIAIPKTYALASLFVAIGFYLLAFVCDGAKRSAFCATGAGLSLALAAGTRISLGILLAVAGIFLLMSFRQLRWNFLWFALGGMVGLSVVYGFFLADPVARTGLLAAQSYHAARGGFDLLFTIGSVSRLVRWYLPLFIVLGLGGFRKGGVLLWGAVAVFVVQMLAPFPYEDYQVPVMGILAVYAAVNFVNRFAGTREHQIPLLVLGLAWACAFGSPLLEKWTTNGQDRLWTIKKDRCELAQLRDVARIIEEEDSNGKTLLTQDLYLAIETGRKVPEGLEMGPFSILSDEAWRQLLSSAPCPIAALSGYSFAINPPRCDEVPIDRQMEYWGLLKKDYDLIAREEYFGQNATTLLVLKRKNLAP